MLRSNCLCCVLSACAALGLARLAPAQTPEFRAAWADVFHVGMGSTAEVNNMVNSLVTGHYNAVIVQVVGYMDSGTSSHGAQYKSNILPWSTRVTSSFDPLAYLCTQAHANGIEVHAWLGGSGGGPYRVSSSWPPAGNATLTAHPEWLMVARTNSEGGVAMPYYYITGTAPNLKTNIYYLLDMGSPDVQDYLVSIVRELVTNYPIDGINWDDEIDGPEYSPMGIGFPAFSTSVYTNSGLARYRRNTGYIGTPSATDAAYGDYRRRFKNELMARTQAEIQSIKTNPRQPLRHTSAALAYSPVPASCDFTTSTPYVYYCDWAGMLQHGWVDAVVPQTYSSSTFSNWVDRIAACWQYNRQVFPGIGAYLQSDATIAGEITYTRSKGLKGNSIYSYAVPNSAGNGDWWAYAASTVYTDIVSTPTMPWRDPATAVDGMMWGRVQDAKTGFYVDDATVTVSGGPTVKTDGNGYYVATLIPASAGGTVHSTTASKTGMSSQTIANATVLAGDIVRYDFILNGSPPGITNQPQSLSLIAGQDATFSVTAGGTPPLAYQWRFNNAIIGNGTASSYTRSNAQPADAGSYTVVVTNSYGAITSSPATLTISVTLTASSTPGGTVSRNPDQASYAPNSTVALTAAPSSGWLFSGWSGDAGGTANPLSVLLTTNKSITANFASTVADLILDNTDPAVTYVGSWQTGTSSTDKYGADYRFASTVVGGTSNVTYRPNIGTPGYYDVYIWYPQGSNRATNAPWQVVYNGGTLNVAVNQTVNGGAWRLIAAARPFWSGTGGYVQVSNNSIQPGAVVMADAVRFAFSGTQDTRPQITTPPQPQTVNQGTSATFNVIASGSPLNYQWRFYGTNLPGANGSSYTVPSAQPGNAGPYSVVVSNTAGLDTSPDAALTLNTPPSVSVIPPSLTTNVGANVAFSLSADGTTPLTYQWRLNGTAINGATDTRYTRSGVQPSDAGGYSVVASNSLGMATSLASFLTVVVPHIDSLLPLPNQGFQLQMSGGPGHFAVEATPSFASWTQLVTLSATGSVFQYLDPDLTPSSRFYRIRGLP